MIKILLIQASVDDKVGVCGYLFCEHKRGLRDSGHDVHNCLRNDSHKRKLTSTRNLPMKHAKRKD